MRDCISCKYKTNKLLDDEPCIGCIDGCEWKQQDESEEEHEQKESN